MPESRWSLAQRIAFRFLFAYFFLFFLPGWVARFLPFGESIVRAYDALWLGTGTWLEEHLLHTGYKIELSDGGGGISNTAFGTILFFCYVAIAAVVAAVWSALDRRRPHYGRLHEWFRFALRFSLGLALIHYGIIKAIPLQMISPPPLMSKRLGELTPMLLLWNFMGASPAYERLTGCAELLGGVLLLVPRTTLLGALVCLADMTMVVVLNFCYDVHVKLFSLHLWTMAAILIAPDLRRLADLLLFNRGVEPAPEPPPLFERKWLNRAPHVLFFLFGLYTIGTTFATTYEQYRKRQQPRPPLFGLWSVEEFVVDGKEVPLFTDPQRWRWVSIRKPGSMSVEVMIGSYQRYTLNLNMRSRRMVLGKRDAGQGAFSFHQPEEDVLILDGQLDGRRTHAALRQSPLLAKRFHWIFVPLPEE